MSVGADLVIFDPAAVGRATSEQPTELTVGNPKVFVGSELASADGAPVNTNFGRVLRR